MNVSAHFQVSAGFNAVLQYFESTCSGHHIAPTEKYDLSMDLSDCVDYGFSIYYSIGFDTLL